MTSGDPANGIRVGRLFRVVTFSVMLSSLALDGCSQTNSENRPFFRHEYGLDTHGRKTWFDHVVELDPGKIKTQIALDYESVAPQTIAVLPFTDCGSANYILNKIPLTNRNADERADWAWTDANRMRRAITGQLASREFIEANLIQVDTVLKQHGVDSGEKLEKVAPQTLGQWLGVDAVVYGEITHYESYYALLLSARQVEADVRMVSTRNGENLFVATGSRYSVSLLLAFDPLGIMLNSALSLLELRDVTLARAEQEAAREIVLRIPRSERLENQLIEEVSTNSNNDLVFSE